MPAFGPISGITISDAGRRNLASVSVAIPTLTLNLNTSPVGVVAGGSVIISRNALNLQVNPIAPNVIGAVAVKVSMNVLRLKIETLEPEVIIVQPPSKKRTSPFIIAHL